jgi:hypothetical protein
MGGIRPKKHLGELLLNYPRAFRGFSTPEVPECYAKIQSDFKIENVLLKQTAKAGVGE